MLFSLVSVKNDCVWSLIAVYYTNQMYLDYDIILVNIYVKRLLR